ncbi:hypothetical protein YC2023_044478 [Brassica napus]
MRVGHMPHLCFTWVRPWSPANKSRVFSKQDRALEILFQNCSNPDDDAFKISDQKQVAKPKTSIKRTKEEEDRLDRRQNTGNSVFAMCQWTNLKAYKRKIKEKKEIIKKIKT